MVDREIQLLSKIFSLAMMLKRLGKTPCATLRLSVCDCTTFGTRAVDGGAPVSAVLAVMGHKGINTTTRYVQATDEGKRRAVAAAVNGAKITRFVSNPSQAEKAAG